MTPQNNGTNMYAYNFGLSCLVSDFRLGVVHLGSLPANFRFWSFARDPRMKSYAWSCSSFIWDLSFGIRRLVSCLQTADHFLHSHTDTRTNKLGAHKTKKTKRNQVFSLGRFFTWWNLMEWHENSWKSWKSEKINKIAASWNRAKVSLGAGPRCHRGPQVANQQPASPAHRVIESSSHQV